MTDKSTTRSRILSGITYILAAWGVFSIVLMVAFWIYFPSASTAANTAVASKGVKAPPVVEKPEELYLELLKRVLTRYQFTQPYQQIPDSAAPKYRVQRAVYNSVKRLLGKGDLSIVRVTPFDPEARENGLDSPIDAETMIGLRRLDNLQNCIVDVMRHNVPGDLIETGAWRGGACIFMRAVLKAYGDKTRAVWVADSFQGLPVPDPKTRAEDASLWSGGEMAVSLDEVKRNFTNYGLLDDRVKFLKGFFADTLPKAPIQRLAILRLDGDLYDSTMDSLNNLYPKLSPGGYLIVDDFNLGPCRKAIDDYRKAHGVSEEIKPIDLSGVFWQKLRSLPYR